MRLVLPWTREFAEAGADVGRVATRLAECGFEVASVEAGSTPVVDFEITANRPDCLSHVGFAREAAGNSGDAASLGSNG